MTSKMIMVVAALAFAFRAASAAMAARQHHIHHDKAKVCTWKGEFMYTKGGKCMDARGKPAKA
jgi:hypothetical protein